MWEYINIFSYNNKYWYTGIDISTLETFSEYTCMSWQPGEKECYTVIKKSTVYVQKTNPISNMNLFLLCYIIIMIHFCFKPIKILHYTIKQYNSLLKTSFIRLARNSRDIQYMSYFFVYSITYHFNLNMSH